LNLKSIYLMVQEVLPGMLEREEGTIVTVTSRAAVNPSALGGAAYGAAKAGALNLMKNINLELRNRGIRACAIVPGDVDTPTMDRRPLPPAEEHRAMMMQPADVAAAIVFCATMPNRTLVEEIYMTPRVSRDMSEELAAASRVGAPPLTE
jgi:NADP-dependent 3-hydroxy acid dehydrogenase YdfG